MGNVFIPFKNPHSVGGIMVLIFSEDPSLDPHINTGIRREMRWAGAAAGQNTVTHGDTGRWPSLVTASIKYSP